MGIKEFLFKKAPNDLVAMVPAAVNSYSLLYDLLSEVPFSFHRRLRK
jgi:hypothetical protein